MKFFNFSFFKKEQKETKTISNDIIVEETTSIFEKVKTIMSIEFNDTLENSYPDNLTTKQKEFIERRYSLHLYEPGFIEIIDSDTLMIFYSYNVYSQYMSCNIVNCNTESVTRIATVGKPYITGNNNFNFYNVEDEFKNTCTETLMLKVIDKKYNEIIEKHNENTTNINSICCKYMEGQK